MLTYTFSRREKTLILVLAIFVVAIAWYMLVFTSTTEQIEKLQSETAMVDDETAIASAKVTQMAYMKNIIEKRKAEGVTPRPIPYYDNMTRLMARLDAVMSVTDSYQLSFGEVDSGSSSYILRPVSISFNCNSYATAEAVVEALATGPYPCVVDSVSIVDNTYRYTSSGLLSRTATNVNCSGTVHVTFFEKNDGSFGNKATVVEEAAE